MEEKFDDKNLESMPNYDYEEDIKVDLNNLHLCLQKQALDADKWGKLWAQTGRKMRRAEERVKTIRSKWILELRLNFKEYGFSKEPTGPQTEAFYRTQDDYIKAKIDQIKLQSDRDDYKIAMDGFRNMKGNMADAQRLYHDEYWTTPVLERQTSENLRRSLHEKELESGTNRIPK